MMRKSIADSSRSSVTPFSSSRSWTSASWRSTMRRKSAWVSELKTTSSSRRLRNSGLAGFGPLVIPSFYASPPSVRGRPAPRRCRRPQRALSCRLFSGLGETRVDGADNGIDEIGYQASFSDFEFSGYFHSWNQTKIWWRITKLYFFNFR